MSINLPVSMSEVSAIAPVDNISYSTYMAPPAAEQAEVENVDNASGPSKITALTTTLKDNLKIAQKKITKGLHKAVQKLDEVLTDHNNDDITAENLMAVLSEQLQCQWCREVLNGPISLPCGHSFCAECWAQVKADPTQQDGTATICPSMGCGLSVPADAPTPMVVALCGVAAVVRARVEADRARRQLESEEAASAAIAAEEAHLQATLGTSEPTPTALDGEEPRTEGTFSNLWTRVKAKSVVVGTHLKEGYNMASEKAAEQIRLVKEKLDKGDAGATEGTHLLNTTEQQAPEAMQAGQQIHIEEPIELDDSRFTLDTTQ